MLNKFFEAVSNIFRVPDLRKRVLFTLGLLAVYRLGSHIPTPGIHLERWQEFFNRSSGTIFGFFDLFAGGNIRRLTVFALGIMPYVSASLIVQAFALIWRFLNRNARRRRDVPVVAVTWCVAILLCAAQAILVALFMERTSAINGGLRIVVNPGWMFRITTLLTLMAGTTSLMLISDQISRRQIGNGMFLVFFAGMVAGLSRALGQVDPFAALTYTALQIAIVAVISRGYRRAIAQAGLG